MNKYIINGANWSCAILSEEFIDASEAATRAIEAIFLNLEPIETHDGEEPNIGLLMSVVSDSFEKSGEYFILSETIMANAGLHSESNALVEKRKGLGEEEDEKWIDFPKF